jgi:hypothetical protein
MSLCEKQVGEKDGKGIFCGYVHNLYVRQRL